jgi:hypothetical protein
MFESFFDRREKLSISQTMLSAEPEARDPGLKRGVEASPQAAAAAAAPADAASGSGGDSENSLKMQSCGSGPEVPRYLRWSGPVRVRNFSKRMTEQMVKDVWAAKKEFDSHRKQRTTLHQFLYTFLSDKYQTQLVCFLNTLECEKTIRSIFILQCNVVLNELQEVAETGHNFLSALQRYAYDADVELFLKVRENACYVFISQYQIN